MSRRAGRGKRVHSLVRPSVLSIGEIRIDGGTQPREATDPDVVARYAERMAWDADSERVVDPEGKGWERLTVFTDEDGTQWLADGFHRLHAARAAGVERFQVVNEQGSLRDAVRYSLQVNARHGSRRSDSDKRRAVARALADAEWVHYADTRLAKMCAVSKTFVGNLRRELEARGEIERCIELEGEDGSMREREPAPLEAATPAATGPKARRVPRSTRSCGASPGAAARLVVSYPGTPDAWGALADEAPELIERGAALACCFAQGSRAAFDGPSLIAAALGEAARPRIVHLTDLDRFFLVFAPGDSGLPSSTTAGHLAATFGDAPPEFMGEALDRWS